MENSNDNFYNAGRSFIIGDFRTSIEFYSQIIEKDQNNFAAFLYRGSARINQEEYLLALEDFVLAEKIQPNSFELHYKKGQSLFLLDRFSEANETFKKALTLANNNEQRQKLVTWSNKVEIELEERGLHILDLPSNIKVINSWYQTGTHVVLSIDSNVNMSKYDFILEKKTIKITCPGNEKPVWEMNLSNSIVPESSKVTKKDHKAELNLKKEIDHFNWVTIDRTKVGEVVSNSQPIYPTSSKKKKDWNNLEKEINQQLAEDAKNDPNEGMMRLFKEIYGNASEETRRAMIKSFQTSGGTVLSTNWDEVKEKDYEGKDRPEAPKGQEWKKD
jgi:suppressor of G2 allele of SKP1